MPVREEVVPTPAVAVVLGWAVVVVVGVGVGGAGEEVLVHHGPTLQSR